MSCFWDSLLQKINKGDLQNKNINNPQDLVEYLQKNNVITDNVLWNDESLSTKQMEENKEHISDYDKATMGQGYLCSTCDPFLLLICELFEITIKNNYNGTQITYKNKIKNNYIIQILNTTSHMS